MAEDSGEKQFEASQKKLDDAREKGELPRSPEFLSALVLLVFIGTLIGFGGSITNQLGQAFSGALEHGASSANPDTSVLARGLMAPVMKAIAPVFVGAAAVALLILIGTRNLNFAPTRLMPDLKRINPWGGLKQRFGLEGLTSFLISQLKATTLLIVTALVIWRGLDRFSHLATLEAGPGWMVMRDELQDFLLIAGLIVLTYGSLDFLVKRFQFSARMRMTRQEMVDEHKESEGDPHVKGQRRQRGQEIALNRMLKDVPSADVIIVNPEHYAVALKWSRAKGAAPICVAKGVDEVAAAIRRAANEAGVPIHRDPPTARAIYASVKIGQEILPDQYRAVAAAIRFAENIRKRAAKKGFGA